MTETSAKATKFGVFMAQVGDYVLYHDCDNGVR
jgi:hypothetical protein